MSKYVVTLHEVWERRIIVDADSVENAKTQAVFGQNLCKETFDYSWTVQDEIAVEPYEDDTQGR